jgi:ElaB/YqjD/DUF883 family membrane-anchored ribosome-binding protein
MDRAEQEVKETAGEVQESASSAIESATDATGRVMRSAADAASGAAETATTAVKEAAEGAERTLEEGLTAVSEQASAAVAGVAGGPEVLKHVTDFFGSATKALQGITDSESAQAAATDLTELHERVDGMAQGIGDLPAEAQAAIKKVIEKGLAGLKIVAEKVEEIPGVETVVKPKVDELMAKLEALVHQ